MLALGLSRISGMNHEEMRFRFIESELWGFKVYAFLFVSSSLRLLTFPLIFSEYGF